MKALVPLALLLVFVVPFAGCNCGGSATVGGNKDGGIGQDGGNGSPDGGVSGNPDSGNGGPQDSGVTDSGSFYYDGGCGPIDAGNPPFPRKCAPPTDNECAGSTDTWLTANGVGSGLLNGQQGNGFDDDCDGQVDEGCYCPSVGQTKTCYLVPATQVDPATSEPVGWCTANSKGSVDCAGGEFSFWSGICRGAQPPYPHDTCAPGDFNCDGLPSNPDDTGCDCQNTIVTCPTATVTEAPYPPPGNIPAIDGTQWIQPSYVSSATNWTWTVLGGDCDNVLPHPTFALYNGANSASATRVGTRTPVQFNAGLSPPRYATSPDAGLIAIQASNIASGSNAGIVYPAFGLSGDYIVQGEFDISGVHYVCTQKVAVRAPGVRAELCWDTVGGAGSSNGNDVDLHFARLQGVGSCSSHGWDTTCTVNSTYEDCFYDPQSGCRDTSGTGPKWGYTDSPNSACIGWSSERNPKDGVTYFQGCTNPRLDLDNISCDPSVDDPTQTSSVNSTSYFCGPENINLDNPKDGDKFVIGVNEYGNNSGTSNVHPHVNIYCNGQRVISAGYNPATGQTRFPLMNKPGGDSTGDLWTVATVLTHVDGGQIASCDVATVPSHDTDPTRDGLATTGSTGSPICVDSTANQSSPSFSYTNHAFVESGSHQTGLTAGQIPPNAAGFCKH